MKKGRPTDIIHLWATPLLSLLFVFYTLFVFHLSPPSSIVIIFIWLIWTGFSAHSWIQGSTEFSYGFRFVKAFGKNAGKKTRTILFFCLVKAFWLPLMLDFSVGNFYAILQNGERWMRSIFSSASLFQLIDSTYLLLVPLFFFIDTVIFLFGYSFESKGLNNKIRSVDSTLLGWVVALICYPPLHQKLTSVVSWHSSDFPVFSNPLMGVLIHTLMIVLLGIYVYASISLGFKSSNMTNRGIVTSGPYSLVRHPAYAAKSIFWALGGIPLISSKPALLFTCLFWSLIYILRAYTEERHLRKDNDYLLYCEKVKYMFLPKVI